MILKKLAIWIGISQLFIFIACGSVYKKITLLGYTNTSFVLGLSFVLIALFGFVIKGRFFDLVFYSFQNFFGKMESTERRPLSQLMPQSYQYLFLTGIITLLAMSITLFYYF